MMDLWASQEKKCEKLFFAPLNSMKKGVGSRVGSGSGAGFGTGSGSISQRHGVRWSNHTYIAQWWAK
jgi:hypothetical protein